jgi:hypothetical protein
VPAAVRLRSGIPLLAGGNELALFLAEVRRRVPGKTELASATARHHPVRSPSQPHLAFGAGAYFCLGAPLARMLLSVLFDELGQSVGEIKVIGSPQRVASYHLWGYSSLMVELTRRPIQSPYALSR